MPPGLSMTSSVMPWTMNIVDSVTTIGCRRRKAMKKPLNAPTSMPMPTPAIDQTRMLEGESCIQVAEHDIDQRDHGAGREVEAAGQDDERLADRGERQRGAARRQKAHLEIAHRPGADQVIDEEEQRRRRRPR